MPSRSCLHGLRSARSRRVRERGTTPARRKSVHRNGLGGTSTARSDGRSREEERILALAALLVVVSHGILNKGITWSRGERPRHTSSQCVHKEERWLKPTACGTR